jgi:DNA-binding LacI/PurR family transcriptional regulator
MVQAAHARGFTVLIDQTEGDQERERLVLRGIRPHLIDGLIFSPLALGSADLAPRADQTPMVLLGERVTEGAVDHVMIDNVAAAAEAVQHLAAGGRRRIAAIGAQHGARGQTAHLRLTGYRHGLEQAGLAYRPDLVADAEAFHRADGAASMARLLDRDRRDWPDAVFAFNDLLALGALRACYERGVRVPGDVAIVGFDDVEDGCYSIPSLTTVSPDKEQIAQVAVDCLLSRLAGEASAPPRHVTARHRLVVRESSGP